VEGAFLNFILAERKWITEAKGRSLCVWGFGGDAFGDGLLAISSPPVGPCRRGSAPYAREGGGRVVQSHDGGVSRVAVV
jgi:hypothetical protein